MILLVEDRIVLGSTIWRSEFPSFVLGHFFLLGVGLGFDIEWAGVPGSFDLTYIYIYIYIYNFYLINNKLYTLIVVYRFIEV